jgi:molybdenum cofactor biosynthesis enzyme MoaA
VQPRLRGLRQRSITRRKCCRSASASADALNAVDECGAPIVSIPGGEPLIHKEMAQIVAGIVARKKFVYLCTNAILLAKHIDEYRPSPY